MTKNNLRTTIAYIALSSLLVVGAASCVTDEPTEEDYDDVAQGISVAISDGQGGGDMGSIADALSLAAAITPDGFSATAEGSYQGQHAGLNYSYEITCRDAAGGPAVACNPDTTDEARLVVAWDGTLDLPQYDAAATRTGDWTLSGIQSGTATLNGDGSFSFDSEFMSLDGNRMRTWQLDYAASYDGVQIDVDTAAAVGGNAVFNVAARRTASNRFRDVEAEFDIEVDVTFNGDGTATLLLDGSRSYELELASGVVIKRSL